jgi:hypothetical protein
MIVRKRSKESENEANSDDVKKSKQASDSNVDKSEIAEATNNDEQKSPEKPKVLNGLGALAGLGDYSSDSDNEEET